MSLIAHVSEKSDTDTLQSLKVMFLTCSFENLQTSYDRTTYFLDFE